MDKKKKKELRGKAHKLQPTVRVGKSGITQAVVDELAVQLEQKKLVKTKVLGCDRHEVRRISEELGRRSDSEVVDVRGNIILLYKE